jgi:hypothetical protein
MKGQKDRSMVDWDWSLETHTGVCVNRDMGPWKGQAVSSNTTESKHTRAFSPAIPHLITRISGMEFVQIPPKL